MSEATKVQGRGIGRWWAVLLPLAGATLVGLLVGWGARFAFVIGLLVGALGLTAGALSGVAALVSRGFVGRGALGLAVVSVIAGWLAFQWMDDAYFQQTYRADFAAARFADSGASADEAITDDDIAFYGEGADEALADQVVAAVGTDGPIGRWLFRGQAGVRLVGPWNHGRGLAVGLTGAVIWALLELILSVLLARVVLSRMQQRQRGGTPSTSRASADVTGDLDHQGGQNRDPA